MEVYEKEKKERKGEILIKKSGMSHRLMMGTLMVVFVYFFCIPAQAQVNIRVAEVTYLEGIVEVQKGEEWIQAEIGMALQQGNKVRTGASSYVELKLDDNSLLKINEETQMQIVTLDEVGADKSKVSLFKLFIGELKTIAGKLLGKQARLEIQTPTCIAGVRGSAFVVTAEEDEASDVEVYEGEVLVESLNEKGERAHPLKLGPDYATRIVRHNPPLRAEKIQNYRREKWELWKMRKDLYHSAGKIENARLRLDEYKQDLKKAQTDGEIKVILKKMEITRNIIKKLTENQEKARVNFAQAKEKHKEKVSQAVEKWKKLPPEEQAKARRNFEIWKKVSPNAALLRKKIAKDIYEKWKALPPERKQKILFAYRLWKELPQEKKMALREKIRRFKHLPPEWRARIKRHYEKWRALPPGQRKKTTEAWKRWQKLPPEKRGMLKERIEKFRHLPPDKRQEVIRKHREKLLPPAKEKILPRKEEPKVKPVPAPVKPRGKIEPVPSQKSPELKSPEGEGK